MNEELIMTAYKATSYYAAMMPGGILFAESPEEQGLTDGDPQESLLRLFINKDDVEAYCDYVRISYGDVSVTEVTLKDVWYLLEDIESLSEVQYNCPVRIAFCALDEDNWPVDIDTIHGFLMLPS
jgi:hypothetical protein